jgi:hypothetical protein
MKNWGTATLYFRLKMRSTQFRDIRAVVKRLHEDRGTEVLECYETWLRETGEPVTVLGLMSRQAFQDESEAEAWSRQFREELVKILPHQDLLLEMGGQTHDRELYQ